MKLKPLSFEPKFHRRVARGRYVLVSSPSSKPPSATTLEAMKAEENAIVSEGYDIVQKDMERPFKDLKDVDKGDVASVIANSNPQFRNSTLAE